MGTIRHRVEAWLNAQWYTASNPNWFLRLLTPVYRVLRVVDQRSKAPQPCIKPIVMVGNLTIGGSGKTPFCGWLIEQAKRDGLKPGLISRGYGRKSNAVLRVQDHHRADAVGDEPLLLFRQYQIPIAVASDRMAAAQLIADEVDFLICDDGLQNVLIPRLLEVLIIDGERGFGNQHSLPAGPLREPLPENLANRFPLRVISVAGIAKYLDPGAFQAQLKISFAKPTDGAGAKVAQSAAAQATAQVARSAVAQASAAPATIPLTEFNQPCLALAGIGNPERFYSALRSHGLKIEPIALGDHQRLSDAELELLLARKQVILMTEKDAIKYPAHPLLFSVPLQYQLDLGLWRLIREQLAAAGSNG